MKDVDRRRDIDDDRENTNGDDRKGKFTRCKDLDPPLIDLFQSTSDLLFLLTTS